MRIMTTLLVLPFLAACARQPEVPERTALDTFRAWSQSQFAFSTNAPQCESTTLSDGTVQLDVFGLTSSNLQHSLVLALTSTSPVPSKVTFWKSQHSWSLRSVFSQIEEVGQAPTFDKDAWEKERRAKLIREVALHE